MNITLFLIGMSLLYALSFPMNKRYKVAPIIIQLLIASICVPIITHYYNEYNSLNINKEILTNKYYKLFYDINFSLLLAYILSETVESKIELRSIKLSIFSFIIPFIGGLIISYFYLDVWNMLEGVSLALLFSITAVPVLYMLLRNLKYPEEEIKKLVQSAIVIDFICWILFALVKENTKFQQLIWIILISSSPYLCKVFKIKSPYILGTIFLISVVVLDILKMNVLLFGVLFIFNCSVAKLKFTIPINEQISKNYQNYIAIPYILTFGMLQVNAHSFLTQLSYIHLLLFISPIILKISGNYIGLLWIERDKPFIDRMQNAILLNTRGLTEIVFLNMLLSQHIITDITYMVILLMSITSTLLPSITEMYKLKKQNHEIIK